MKQTFENAAMSFARPMHWRMKHKQQRAYRYGDWKYLKIDEHEYLFNIERDARERANQAHRQPDRLDKMRAAWEAWNAQIPPVPPDARTHLVYTLENMPSR